MDCQLPTSKAAVCLILVGVIFLPYPCPAGEVDTDLFGFTYHLHRKGAVYNAPLKLDRPGVKVFNPGLGIGYDFREDRHKSGMSAIVHGGMFENCDNHPFSFAGAGARYRKYFSKKNFFEVNVLATLTLGNASDHKGYNLTPAPYVNLGLGHDYGKYSVVYYLSYIPKDADGSITSSTDMLFLSMGIDF